MKQMEQPPLIVVHPESISAEDLENMRPGALIKVKTGVVLSEDDLAELSKLLGRNIADADDLLLAARNVTTLSIEGLEGGDIVLDSYLLNRLKSRCHPTQDFPTFVRDRVKELLASYAGC